METDGSVFLRISILVVVMYFVITGVVVVTQLNI